MSDNYYTGEDILKRWEGNPAIVIEDIPFRANTVFNGTPIVTNDGILLLLRVEGQQGYSFFALARSSDGLHFKIDPEPVMMPAKEGRFAKYESRGLEDPRATIIDGVCYIMYTAVGNWGSRIALAKTSNFTDYERIAIVSEPGNKDGVLFPRKINDLYARLDRPIGQNCGSVWISYSPDLINWGKSEVVMTPRHGYWDDYRIGASVPPIETNDGWLEIYHGVKMTSAGPIYRIGAVLLNLENPAVVLKRGAIPILSPHTYYERIGDIPNVCFACGAVLNNNDKILIYYGAADTSICIAESTIEEILSAAFI